MNSLLFLVAFLFSFSASAQPSVSVPTVKMSPGAVSLSAATANINIPPQKNIFGREKGNFSLDIDLETKKEGLTKILTHDGKSVQKLQRLNRSCFKSDMKDDEIKKFADKLKSFGITYEGVERDFLDFMKTAAIPSLVVESVTYDRPDLFEYFKDKQKGKGSLFFKTCSFPFSRNTPVTEKLKKCAEDNIRGGNFRWMPLECRVDYSCAKETSVEEELTPFSFVCDKQIFGSDETSISDDTAINDCLKRISSKALNVKVKIESCSTTLKRASGTNLELTNLRLNSMKDMLVKKLEGLKFKDFEIFYDYSNENLYYTDNNTNGTGTCGPRTSESSLHEDWVEKYKTSTKLYVDENNLKGDPNYAWIWMDVPNVKVSKVSPDSLLSSWRYSKISVFYDVLETKTIEAVANGTPSVKCLYVQGEPKKGILDPLKREGNITVGPRNTSSDVRQGNATCPGMSGEGSANIGCERVYHR